MPPGQNALFLVVIVRTCVRMVTMPVVRVIVMRMMFAVSMRGVGSMCVCCCL
jgi:hypothetical protein